MQNIFMIERLDKWRCSRQCVGMMVFVVGVDCAVTCASALLLVPATEDPQELPDVEFGASARESEGRLSTMYETCGVRKSCSGSLLLREVGGELEVQASAGARAS
jgi:hypothetical protein